MPLESLACTNCGSPDVKEVKPETYFCNQCDSVFKHVDPSKVTAVPGFCLCGNPATVQCQICHFSTMCSGCDAGKYAWHTDRGGPCIETVGFGYVLPAGREWWLERNRLPVESRDETIGPCLPISKLMAALPSVRHVCWPCLASALANAVADLVDRLASGFACQIPVCGERADLVCRCCGAAGCSKHIFSPPARSLVTGSILDNRMAVPGVRALPNYDLLCSRCTYESIDRIKRLAVAYPDLITDGYRCQVSTKDKKLLSRRRRLVTDKQDLLNAERYSVQLAKQLEENLSDPCVCEESPSTIRSQWMYSIFDDRANTAPAAAPGVLGPS